MTPWPSTATASSVASSTPMWEAGELDLTVLAVAVAVAVAVAAVAVFLFYRCKSRNVTGEELGLHIQEGCYLVSLEEWQVQA